MDKLDCDLELFQIPSQRGKHAATPEGFSMNPLISAHLKTGIINRGLYETRFLYEDYSVLVAIGLQAKPDADRPTIVRLILAEVVDLSSDTTPLGYVLESDPLALPGNLPGRSPPRFVELLRDRVATEYKIAHRIVAGLFNILYTTNVIHDGTLVNAEALSALMSSPNLEDMLGLCIVDPKRDWNNLYSLGIADEYSRTESQRVLTEHVGKVGELCLRVGQGPLLNHLLHEPGVFGHVFVACNLPDNPGGKGTGIPDLAYSHREWELCPSGGTVPPEHYARQYSSRIVAGDPHLFPFWKGVFLKMLSRIKGDNLRLYILVGRLSHTYLVLDPGWIEGGVQLADPNSSSLKEELPRSVSHLLLQLEVIFQSWKSHR